MSATDASSEGKLTSLQVPGSCWERIMPSGPYLVRFDDATARNLRRPCIDGCDGRVGEAFERTMKE